MHEDHGTPSRPAWVSGTLAAALAILAGLLRLVPHAPNFAPVGALGLFGGARLRSWVAFALPLAVMAGSDLVLWRVYGYPPFNPFVYASFLLAVLLGRLLVKGDDPWTLAGASLLTSAQFFVLTNLGVWLEGTLYPRTLAGLLDCYAAALPFFHNTLTSDLLYSGLFFGLHALFLLLTQHQKAGQAT
jgi:hypothetical protein